MTSSPLRSGDGASAVSLASTPSSSARGHFFRSLRCIRCRPTTNSQSSIRYAYRSGSSSRQSSKTHRSCSEDLEVFARHIDASPANLFDTQVASGFLGTEFSPSYADLVMRYTGQQLNKHETRSDWLARPLREEQLRYAVEDVLHLLPVYRAQLTELTRLGRQPWFDEEMRHRVGFKLVDPDRCYANVRKSWRCDRRQLARLQLLCAWRERYAREKDLPRGHVVKDDQLVELVQHRSVDKETIVNTIDPASARRHGRELLAGIEQADALPDDALPPPSPPPFTASETRTLKQLKSIGAEKSRALDMAEELLSRRRDMEMCLRSLRSEGRLPENFRGWRYALIGESFESKLGEAGA
jgi:ribonuclease D